MVAKIAPAIKDRIQAVTEESKRADHAVIEIRITRTANEASLSIHTLKEEGRGTIKKILKKKTFLSIERKDLSKPLFHCIQRLDQSFNSVKFISEKSEFSPSSL